MLKKSALAGMFLCFICSYSLKADESKKPSPGISYKVMQDKLVLDEKGDDYLMFCKRRFDITSYTLIKNERGTIIPFEELDVPCEAMVSYYKKPEKKRRYVVVSIEIRGEIQPQPR